MIKFFLSVKRYLTTLALIDPECASFPRYKFQSCKAIDVSRIPMHRELQKNEARKGFQDGACKEHDVWAREPGVVYAWGVWWGRRVASTHPSVSILSTHST
jgi:hypothetical protein